MILISLGVLASVVSTRDLYNVVILNYKEIEFLKIFILYTILSLLWSVCTMKPLMTQSHYLYL